MGGHGGLNILPQKKWNVYNFDNREKVRKDEEAAAKDEQLKREQSRRRDSELRLEQLRRARGLDPGAPPPPETPASAPAKSTSIPIASTPTKSTAIPEEAKSDSKHINLFDGIKIFDPVAVDGKRKKRRDEEENDRRKKMKKEEVRVVGPEDEVYRLGYGVAGKGVTAPWYTKKREVDKEDKEDEEEEDERERKVVVKKKKSVEELREERLKREKAEKERQWALVSRNAGTQRQFGRDRERRQWR